MISRIAAARSSLRPSWAGRNYSLLTAAAVVTNLGSQGALIAAAFAVLQSGGDSTDVGVVAAARTLPLVLFLLVAGAVADRLPRHRVMVAANALSCVSQAVFGALVVTGNARLWEMVLLTALGGTGLAFFSPASEGMLMASVSGAQASRAFAVYRMAQNGAGIGGAALGGALVAVLGPGWVLVVDAVCFAVAAALRGLLQLDLSGPRDAAGSVLAQLREGWREFIGRPWLWSIVAQFSIVVAVVGAAESVYGPLVARDELGGAGPWGLALGAFGVGTVGGALLMVRWKPRRLLFAGTLCVFPLAMPSAALAVPLPVGPLAVVMFVSGVCIEVFGVAWVTTMHQEIPEEMFSRVSSYDWLGSIGLLPLATAVAGPAERAFGRSTALWSCAALVVLTTAAVLFVPDVRRLTRRTHEPAATPAAHPPPTTGMLAPEHTPTEPDPALPGEEPAVSGARGAGPADAGEPSGAAGRPPGTRT